MKMGEIKMKVFASLPFYEGKTRVPARRVEALAQAYELGRGLTLHIRWCEPQ
jgi:hypothetical protein